MRLHGAAELAIDMAKESRLPVGIKAEHAAEPSSGRENTGRSGTKKAQTRCGRHAQVTSGVDPQHDRRNEVAPADATDKVRMGHDGSKTHGHRMNDGDFVHTIEF